MYKVRELYAHDKLKSLLSYTSSTEVSCIAELRTSCDVYFWLRKVDELPKPSGLYTAALLSRDADRPEATKGSPEKQLKALAACSRVCTLIRLPSRSDLYLVNDELRQLFSHLLDMKFIYSNLQSYTRMFRYDEYEPAEPPQPMPDGYLVAMLDVELPKD
jgi:hypothetical protein